MKTLTAILVILIGFLAWTADAGAPSRSRAIDFDDEIVEGINKKPLDSLSQISERERNKKRLHLYRKRSGYTVDTKETLNEMRYAQ